MNDAQNYAMVMIIKISTQILWQATRSSTPLVISIFKCNKDLNLDSHKCKERWKMFQVVGKRSYHHTSISLMSHRQSVTYFAQQIRGFVLNRIQLYTKLYSSTKLCVTEARL